MTTTPNPFAPAATLRRIDGAAVHVHADDSHRTQTFDLINYAFTDPATKQRRGTLIVRASIACADQPAYVAALNITEFLSAHMRTLVDAHSPVVFTTAQQREAQLHVRKLLNERDRIAETPVEKCKCYRTCKGACQQSQRDDLSSRRRWLAEVIQFLVRTHGLEEAQLARSTGVD